MLFSGATGVEAWRFPFRSRKGRMTQKIDYLKHAEKARHAAEQLTCNPARRDQWIEIEHMYRAMAERRTTRAARGPAIPPAHATSSRTAGSR
jgi:hypothetical protein